MFRFFIVKLSFSFTNIKTITVPAICFVNTSSLLQTINAGSKESLCCERFEKK